MVQLSEVRSLWYWDHTGGFPQHWYHLQSESQVEVVQYDTTELVSIDLQQAGADAFLALILLSCHLT